VEEENKEMREWKRNRKYGGRDCRAVDNSFLH
jgi:hypothetical protein